MTVEGWVYEAIEAHGKAGATLRDIQRHIDEYRHEELATDTLESALVRLQSRGRVTSGGTRWVIAARTSKEDALKKLFQE